MTAYGSVELADAYHVTRGNAGWTGTEQAKTQALQRASDWIDTTYRGAFPGYKVGRRDQEREWPRYDAVDAAGDAIPVDEVPSEVLHATYEAALRELSSAGSLMPDFVPGAAIKREKVGPIETEYLGGTSATSVLPVLTIVDRMLAPLLVRGGGPSVLTMRAVRA